MNPSIHHSISITLLLLWEVVLLSLGKSTDSLATVPTVVRDVKEVIRILIQFNFVALLWHVSSSYIRTFSFKANQFQQYLLFRKSGSRVGWKMGRDLIFFWETLRGIRNGHFFIHRNCLVWGISKTQINSK